MRWTNAEQADKGAVKIPRNWLFLHYYEALTALFRVENALRMFVYFVLKDREKAKWGELTITSDDGSSSSIAATAKKRVSQDERFGYLGYSISSPLMHLTSGELIRIILADSYWPWFASYFPATKELVRTKLEEIGNIRNALAHFRPIKPDDVQVVKQNANQVLSRVEVALKNLVSASQTVPTNNAEEWYRALRALGGQYAELAFAQSEDENWIQLDLKYRSPIVGQPYTSDSYHQYRVLTLNTPKMLRASAVILDNVIFVSDYVPYQDTVPPSFSKTVQLLFSRQTMREHHVELKSELERLLSEITKETDLIRDDNLARGEFVHTVYLTASLKEGRWTVESGNLYSPIREDNPVEYWGGKPFWPGDFVTDTESFPWMPVDVSQFTVSF